MMPGSLEAVDLRRQERASRIALLSYHPGRAALKQVSSMDPYLLRCRRR